MPQFDFSTLFTVLFSLLICSFFYYSFIALNLMPEIISIAKFRVKSLLKENSSNLSNLFLPNLASYSKAVKIKH